MNTDPRTSPEPLAGSGEGSGAGSGDPAAPETETAGRSDSVAAGTPDQGSGVPERSAGEPEAPVSPASAPADEAHEPAAGAVDGAPASAAPAPDACEPEAAAEPVNVAGLTAKAQKAEEYLDLAQRTRAEFENFRKRAAREAAAAQERGAIKLAKELLPAIDNLDRALAHADTAGESGNGAATFVSGIKHVRSDVLAALARVGIEPFSPDGQPFDPQFHEAVAQQPVDGAASGTVVEVYQRGYRLGESVLRPARVVVAA
jgi:molecular chaperone GrpE